MIKHLTLLLTTALLLFSLTACGCSAKDSGNNGSAVVGGETAGTTEDSTSPNTGTSNGESGSGTGGGSSSGSGGSQNGSASENGTTGSNSGDTLLDDAQNAVNDGLNDAKDALDSATAKAGGTSFRQMMRNGRVHDTDGDLTDGENSRSNGKLF